MQRDVTAFSFTSMTPLKAYVLGFAWSDGSINSHFNVLTFVSKDDLSSLRNVFYPTGDRPVYRRKSGPYQLDVCSRRIVQELVEMGFTSKKSIEGVPSIPQRFERYFLLGLLDGDGTIYSSTNKVLKVFYCGNRETMSLIRSTIENLTGVHFSLREASTENRIIEGRLLNNNHVCYALQLPSIRESQIFLTWLYRNVDDIPFLQRKYQKFLDFQKLYQTIIPCFLCSGPIRRDGTNAKYCAECNILLRRLSNRRSDHENRTGIRRLFVNLLTDTEKARINLEALATLG